MKDSEDFHCIGCHTVNNKIRKARHDKFSSPRDMPNATGFRKSGKPFHKLFDAINYHEGGRRIVLLDPCRANASNATSC